MASITCHFCNQTLTKVYLSAPATIVTVQTVTAEIDLEKDLKAENIKTYERRFLDKPSVQEKELVTFRLESRDEVLDGDIDHYSLEVSSKDLIAFCANCNCEVTEQWKEVLDHA